MHALSEDASAIRRWPLACRVAGLLAVDPVALAGAVVRAGPCPQRDRWLALYAELCGPGMPLLKLRPGVSDEQLTGGLDFARTLTERRPVHERGLLARADGGTIVVTSAELLAPARAAQLAQSLDLGATTTLSEGTAQAETSRICVLAFDEGRDAEECCPAVLRERLAFHVALDGIAMAELVSLPIERQDIVDARARLAGLTLPDDALRALCEAAHALGVASSRAVILAAHAARAIAALDDAGSIDHASLVEAAQLVLGPRARQIPAPEQTEPEQQETEARPPEEAAAAPEEDADTTQDGETLSEVLVEAVRSSLPAGVLPESANRSRRMASGPGDGGALRRSVNRGRQIGSRAGKPRDGARVDVLATLRAAAPWQALRDKDRDDRGGARRAISIRMEDLRIRRFEEPGKSLTVFAVDASGSAALHRLGEAKGAVELLLGDCYTRRDDVALIAFRGAASQLLLPPTRSLTRAKRLLGSLAGGGATPLAHAMMAAHALASDGVRKGRSTTIVLLSDCRANVALDGSSGRTAAERDALAAAGVIRQQRHRVLLIDTAPRPGPFAARLAEALAAHYLALPYSDGRTIATAVQTLAGTGHDRRPHAGSPARQKGVGT